MKITRFLTQSPIFALEQAQRGFYLEFQSRLKEESLNLLQAWVLLSIYFERPEAVLPSQLARTLGTTRANMSHCVSSLEARRMIRRQLNPKDSRSYCLVLRQEGLKTVHRLVRIFDRAQASFEKQVGAQNLRRSIETLLSLRFGG